MDCSAESRRRAWERLTGPWMTGVALLFLVAFAWPILDPGISRQWHEISAVVMDVTWGLFALDYGVRLCLSRQRYRFLLHSPIELLVVLLPMLRPLRLLRLLTVLVVVHRTSAAMLRGRVVVYIVGGALFLAFVGALAMLDAERGAPGAHIDTYGDAVWWALATMTTVGYGDAYPVTMHGRLIAAGMMIGGIALLGSVTASLASWLTDRLAVPDEGAVSAESVAVAELTARVTELTAQLERLTEMIEQQKDAGPAAGEVCSSVLSQSRTDA
ncbi:potassium channel family protein [Dermatophilus congolensis]|nr:potassium channel family protein [Dermatophilus congolensis]